MNADADADFIYLQDLVQFINGDRGKNYPKEKDFVNVGTGVQFISAADLQDGQIRKSGGKWITQIAFDRLGSGKVQKHDLLFCLRGSLGRVAEVTDNSRAAIASSLVILRCKQGVNKDWLLALLQTPTIQFEISILDNGSVQGNISATSLKKLKLPNHSAERQSKIAMLSNTLNSYLRNLQSQNTTLETIALTLFKSWFVDFYPVHVKAAGHQLECLSAEIATLFPSEFEESDHGLIPKGWEMRYFGDLVEVRRGGSPRPIHDYLASEGLPWVKISDATCDKSPFLSETKEFIKESGLKKTAFLKQGSLILSNSATPGVPKFLDIDACVHDGWLHFPSKDTLTDEFLFLYFRFFRDHIVSQGDGSVFVNLKTEILKSQTVVVAPVEVLTSFQNIVEPIFNSILINVRLARTLESIRNELLPRLISGKIRIEEAEEALADVMPLTEKQVA